MRASRRGPRWREMRVVEAPTQSARTRKCAPAAFLHPAVRFALLGRPSRGLV